MKNYFKFQFPWQFVMLIIFTLSGISNEDLPDITFRVWDKFLHFVVFGALGVLVYRGFVNSSWPFIKNNATVYSMIFTIIYGAIDEIHQYFVPGRFASLSDWVADLLGIIVFILLYQYLRPRFPGSQKTGNLDNTGR
jgi:VanZ family protein